MNNKRESRADQNREKEPKISMRNGEESEPEKQQGGGKQ